MIRTVTIVSSARFKLPSASLAGKAESAAGSARNCARHVTRREGLPRRVEAPRLDMHGSPIAAISRIFRKLGWWGQVILHGASLPDVTPSE